MNLFRWTIFNVLIGNHDAHLKNISFLVGNAGITLAPFYDLLSTVVYATREHDAPGPHWPDVELTMPIGQAKFFSDISREGMLEFGVQLGLKESAATHLLDVLVSHLHQGLPAIVESFLDRAPPGQQRLINAIVAMPIKEMSGRMRR